jgi:hypothetical protein
MQTELVIESFGQMLDSLDWLKAESRDRARNKSDHLRKNVGWPRELYGDFNVKVWLNLRKMRKIRWTNELQDTKLLDQYNSRYAPLLSLKSANMFHVVNALRKAGQQTENLDLLAQEPSRAFFGESLKFYNILFKGGTTIAAGSIAAQEGYLHVRIVFCSFLIIIRYLFWNDQHIAAKRSKIGKVIE